MTKLIVSIFSICHFLPLWLLAMSSARNVTGDMKLWEWGLTILEQLGALETGKSRKSAIYMNLLVYTSRQQAMPGLWVSQFDSVRSFSGVS